MSSVRDDTYQKARLNPPQLTSAERKRYYERSQKFMEDDLKRSGLTPADGGFMPVAWSNPMASPDDSVLGEYYILYYDIKGDLLVDIQGNPTMHRTRRNSAERYAQPTRKMLGDLVDTPYFPPNRDRSSETRHIAEGEKKTVVLNKVGMSAIGIGGMDRWCVPKKDGQASRTHILPMIQEEIRNCKTVVLWPDGDISKSHVAKGWAEFAAALRVARPDLTVLVGQVPIGSKIDDEYAKGVDITKLPQHDALILGAGRVDLVNWGAQCRVDKSGLQQPICNVETLGCIFEHAPGLKDEIKYNTRSAIAEWRGLPLDDAGMHKLHRYVLRWTGMPDWALSHVEQVVGSIAMDHKYDPIVDWLRGLTWDGVDRLPGLAVAVGGPAASDAYVQATLRMLLCGGVARAFEPGCQFDSMVVLVGEQEGEGKTTFWSKLFGIRNVTSMWGITQDKDLRMLMARSWCQVMEELDIYGRKSDETMKAMITNRIEEYRPPYASAVITQPRQNVLVGNTNTRRFLRVEGAHRRYFPIDVCARMDNAWVAENRDQLWAQAVSIYAAGGDWWDVPMEGIRAEYRAGADEEDLFVQMMEGWLARDALAKSSGMPVVKAQEVMDGLTALGLKVTDKALAAMMRRHGWATCVVRGTALTWPPGVAVKDGLYGDGNNRVWRRDHKPQM